MRPGPAQNRLQRYLAANMRVAILLWQRFRLSLSLFATIITLGSLTLWHFYAFPQTGHSLTYPEALYTVFSMLFFESIVPLPRGPLQVLFFFIPFLGLTIVAEGLIRFNLLLLDRKNPSGEWTVALASTYSEHIIVCGLGHVGYRVVQQLLAFGQKVLVVEKDPQATFTKGVQRDNVPVLQGDATDLDVLQQAGVDRAKAVIVATNDALVNIKIALNAREQNPDIRIVLRLFDADLAEKVGELFGINTSFSASSIAAPAFATAAIHEGVTHSFFLEGELMHVSEVIVQPGGQLAGRTVYNLEEELDLSVIFLQRGQERDMHPAADLCLEVADKVVVFASLEQLNQLERLNASPKRSPFRSRR